MSNKIDIPSDLDLDQHCLEQNINNAFLPGLVILEQRMDSNWISEFVLPRGIPEELRFWAGVIEKTANELCDPDCKRIKFRINMSRKVEMSAADYVAVECFIQSFKKHENTIPAITRKLIEDAVRICVVKSVSVLDIE